MNRFWISASMTVALSCMCYEAACADALADSLAQLCPKQEWKCNSPVQSYDAKTLFELVDGEAELYFPYGFKRALAATYTHTSNVKESMSLELYELGSVLDAFGAYSNFRDADSKLVDLGTEAFIGSTQLMFYQDRYFVKIHLSRRVNQGDEVVIGCARGVLGLLPTKKKKPEELRMLATKGVAPNTVQYVAQSVLGYDFFSTGLVADLSVNENRGRAFIILEVTPKTAEQALLRYVEYLKNSSARNYWKETTFGKILVAEDPLYKGTIVKRVRNYLVGIARLDDPTRCFSALHELCNNVERR